ncbi:short chain enoyl-CoA hydratase /3-hydroxyacyl-CoA dehydrogenase [Ferrimonas sediminum]|uniref:Short chain enoyl-CoA hydratase /3-hydroxyacyl-CoA dehydrogenase n=1 Tax=Ferrimonas sediminum TaxID=718193 RepID=A0A1G8ZUH6_9GAMM|nr:3-hydroxyacyl-CoA dehydrogenase NAD-binding domain-containing protein [Ferrimonas sediminum]SDK18756.1 short chain enoyl-CoA hydratase /3-hydroxyacyl-CoA dehydrogenase [Ferrimonas sediminum]
MNSLRIEQDQNGIVHLVLDRQGASANLMDEQFAADLAQVVAQLQQMTYCGIIVRSAKSTFFAGGDLGKIAEVTTETGQPFFAMVESIKASMRALETGGKPVVACINGAALGGGWEVALACHHRIAFKHKSVKVGLPEVTLGLLPGGGGIARTVRLFGLKAAMPLLTEGKQFGVEKALKAGLLHELADTEPAMLAQATAFIQANEQVTQPWDMKGYRLPGGNPGSPKMAQMLAVAPAMLKLQTKGVLPAPEAILSAMVEGAQVDFDTACRIESRYFVSLVTGQVAKNLINTFWFQLNDIKAGASRPDGIAATTVTKVGVLGAGMMGAGIAYAAASRGIEVVLKDVSLDCAKKGKGYSETLLAKQLQRGRITADQQREILARIHPSEQVADLGGCELVIEAVFEQRQLKARVTQEAERHLPREAVFASNTSTLPITGLAKASERPSQFIGLHFFSPVDKMPLVEIICGEQTDSATLARAYDFVLQLGKTPIVVNDSRGFFTSRVFGTFTNEGIAMLGEGVSAAAIENAAFLCGFPVGPLAVSDEVSLTLMEKIRNQTIADLADEGIIQPPKAGDATIDRMIELERPGKLAGQGFYDYPPESKKRLWSGLEAQFYRAEAQLPLTEIKDRLLFIMAIETARCYDEQVLTSSRDANIGSIFGIGYPAWTGGALQFINQYGLGRFVARADELAERYGDRFLVPDSLRARADANQQY